MLREGMFFALYHVLFMIVLDKSNLVGLCGCFLAFLVLFRCLLRPVEFLTTYVHTV
jgi:hypothetical protein